MPTSQEREQIENGTFEEDTITIEKEDGDLQEIELLAQSIERKLTNMIDNINEDDFIQDIEEEIERDTNKLMELNQDGQSMLWMYKDFESEENCNEWLEALSTQIVEIQPTPNERLGFFVKLSTR